MKDKHLKDALDEEYPILMQKDFQKSIKNLAELPDYLRKINQNILNIDKRISKKELQTNKVKQFEAQTALRDKTNNVNNKNLLEIKDIVKQSVESLSDLFKNKNQLVDIKPIEEEARNTNSDNQRKKNKLTQTPNPLQAKVNSIHKTKTAKANNTQQNSINTKNTVNAVIQRKSTNNDSSNQANNNDIRSLNKCKSKTKPTKLNTVSVDKSNQMTSNAKHQNKMNTIDEIDIPSHQKIPLPTNSSSKQESTIDQAYCRGYNRKIVRSAHINNEAKDHRNSASSNIKGNLLNAECNIQFNPKLNKETGLANDMPNKRPDTGNKTKINTKKQFKQKSLNEKPNRIFTKRNKNNNDDSDMQKQNKKKERSDSLLKKYYTISFPKTFSIENVLRMLILMKDHFVTSNIISDYSMNSKAFEDFSFILSNQLREIIIESPFDKEIIMSRSTCSDVGGGDSSFKLNLVIKLQRKWRRYKVNQLGCSDKTALRSAIINDVIDNERTGEAQRLIKTINETLESFTNTKNTILIASQLSKVTLNNTSEDEKQKLYKNLINSHLANKGFRNNPGCSLVHNLNTESSYNTILPSFSLSQSNQR